MKSYPFRSAVSRALMCFRNRYPDAVVRLEVHRQRWSRHAWQTGPHNSMQAILTAYVSIKGRGVDTGASFSLSDKGGLIQWD